METMETVGGQSKSTKNRLDELRELFNGGYITESEFKIARLNILDEGGIDVVTQLQSAHRPYLKEDDEDRKGCGCGCFLLTVFLAAFFVLGGIFFAAPYWPEQFGGAGAMAAREWLIAKGTSLLDGVFGESADSQVPDPVPSDVAEAEPPVVVDEPVTTAALRLPEEPSADQTGSAVTASPDIQEPPLSAPDPALFNSVEPIVIEMPALVSMDSDAVSSDIPVPGVSIASGVVTAQSARLRSAPDTSTNDNVVGWGRTGDRFVVMEEGVGSDGSPWYRIQYEGDEGGDKGGWISGSLVRLDR